MKTWIASLAVAAAVVAPLAAHAQAPWPSKPVELIFPYPPGNDADAFFRVLAQGMSKRLGVPVQVINKPGGGGVVGFAEFVRAKPDGYTIGSLTPGPGITQILAGNTPYKQTDYIPMAGCFVNDFVLAARGDIPANNLKEFSDWAKKSGKPVIVGSYSPASVPGLIAAKIARQDGWAYKVVSFANPSAKELTAGDADVTTTGAEMVSSYVKAGQVKVLSTWQPSRNKYYPNAATLKEAGYGDLYLWQGLAVPAGTPKDIVNKLSEVVRQSMEDKEVVDLLAKLGVPAYYLTPEQAAQRIAADTKWMSELMTELGMVKK